jgi:hypothetical protein
MRVFSPKFIIAVSFFCTSMSVNAESFADVNFPGGTISFADKVVLYEPSFGGYPPTTSEYTNTNFVLGPPDCTYSDTSNALSLGGGGRVTFQFLDNVLTGSGDNTADLYIFEIGKSFANAGNESTSVEISANGIDFVSVGSVPGGTSGIDIDSLGFTPSDSFYYVRLTDTSGITARSAYIGADIDAIGAVSTRPLNGATSVNSCTATYTPSTGKLQIPDVAVPVMQPFGGIQTQHYSVEMQQHADSFTFDLLLNSVKPR